MPNWGLPALSWLVSFYFLLGFVIKMGFPPSSPLSSTEATYLFIWLFFLFLPFFKKIKIGKFLELEKEIQQTKSDVQQLKETVQQNFSLMASSINTISNFSNQVTVNLPGASAVREEKKKLEKETESKAESEIDEIKSELTLENEDTIMALARTRISIEHLLRSILGKRTEVQKFKNRPIKLMGIRQLFKLFAEEYPQYSDLEGSISYVNNVCSAAIHAQRLPAGSAEEALDMGARIISVLNEVSEKEKNENCAEHANQPDTD